MVTRISKGTKSDVLRNYLLVPPPVRIPQVCVNSVPLSIVQLRWSPPGEWLQAFIPDEVLDNLHRVFVIELNLFGHPSWRIVPLIQCIEMPNVSKVLQFIEQIVELLFVLESPLTNEGSIGTWRRKGLNDFLAAQHGDTKLLDEIPLLNIRTWPIQGSGPKVQHRRVLRSVDHCQWSS
jgi:hypothetical protein